MKSVVRTSRIAFKNSRTPSARTSVPEILLGFQEVGSLRSRDFEAGSLHVLGA